MTVFQRAQRRREVPAPRVEEKDGGRGRPRSPSRRIHSTIFATAGIGQVYLERIMGLGYLDTQLKIQVHFLMLIAAASIFVIGAMLFIWDFFRRPPSFEVAEGEVVEGGVVEETVVRVKVAIQT